MVGPLRDGALGGLLGPWDIPLMENRYQCFFHTILIALPLLSVSSATHTHRKHISKSNVVNLPGTKTPQTVNQSH